MAYLKQGRIEEAAPLLTRSFDLATQLGGQDHAGAVFLGLRMVALYAAQKRFQEYEALLVRLVEASRRTHGEEHPQTGYIKYALWMRIKELTSRCEQQEASGDTQGASVTLAQLRPLRRAYEGNSQLQNDRIDGSD